MSYLSNKKRKVTRNHAATTIQKWWLKHLKRSGSRKVSGKLTSLIPELKDGPTQLKPPGVSNIESHVGSLMREITSNRIVLGIMIATVITVFCTYSGSDETHKLAMVFLHSQTSHTNEVYNDIALNAARDTSLPTLYEYKFPSGRVQEFPMGQMSLRDREIVKITVKTKELFLATNGTSVETEKISTGLISTRVKVQTEAAVEILGTFFMILCWLIGVMSFVGPVTTLVVVPIERMIYLLDMLMMDPLGYQDTPLFSKFMKEEDEVALTHNWSKDVLKGMETSFLMSTILRIGSLMKVGFGSAGVEIIRKHLEKGKKQSISLSTPGGSTVSCIFLFCDIRQFTDATECLQEEVFVFTNKIAAVVHSICNAYGGSANKNIGDAFLLSWRLNDENISNKKKGGLRKHFMFDKIKRGTQADKALLSVVKINIALHHDNYFLEGMSQKAKIRLLSKLAERPGPVVQLGFGLHAGKAVQGAIGTQRKLDATYLSEAVEFAESLESSTKRYGVKVLMSESFFRELNRANRRRCRKVDQIKESAENEEKEFSNLYTFDMDIDAKWSTKEEDKPGVNADKIQRRFSENRRPNKKFRASMPGPDKFRSSLTGNESTHRRRSLAYQVQRVMSTISDDDPTESVNSRPKDGEETQPKANSELVLPTGPIMYNEAIWLTDAMQKIRHRAHDGLFFQNFKSGLIAYYSRDWDEAKNNFQSILDRFEDGPSTLFMKEIEKYGSKPPPDFKNYNEI